MKTTRSHLLLLFSAALIACCVSLEVAATPYTPDDESAVLERLPLRPGDTALAEIRAAQRALAEQPSDATRARQLAQLYIRQARLDADPRYLGYAEAVLAPWWNAPRPPVDILVTRAIILQANHRFDAALADLADALQRDPANTQAWLTRATIEQAQGDYASARQSCLALLRDARDIVAYACLASVASLNGEAERSYAVLRRVVQDTAGLQPDLEQWVQGLLAEMAARRGDATAADAHFRQAFAAGRADSYLLASYADFLLDQGRAADVVALLRQQTRADALLLRLALAEQALNLPTAAEHIAALRSRFDASRLRGDVLHRREEARFHLELLHDPKTALTLAADNWQAQREPADARLLLAAALRAGTPASAQPVREWLARTRLEDVQLARLLKDLAAEAL
ncbi:MAG: hypothetical protein FD165_796 [Gammaproteobacteria bacterium]|nr:MAG: hypothetical protein FD165_796 [Gammaproteobacteria bacterium]TND07123.1 MAG: hypothetical protein FD120_291 [Gammaproteobacteria bacterium]